MFKKLNINQKIQKAIILRSFKWLNLIYLSILLSLKTLHSFGTYSHINFSNNLYNFFSQIINVKSKFYRRYKRKKKLKKDVFRNFFGNKIKLIRIINDKESDKNNYVKKRRK